MCGWEFFFVCNENGKELIKLRSIVFIFCGTVANWKSERLYAAHCALILLLFLRTDSKVADPLCHFHHWNVHIHLFYCHVNGLAKYTHTLVRFYLLHRTFLKTQKKSRGEKYKVDSWMWMIFRSGKETKKGNLKWRFIQAVYVGCVSSTSKPAQSRIFYKNHWTESIFDVHNFSLHGNDWIGNTP